ncbi:MAG: SH3 domain-containing protein, partial [Bacillota bacterium]|nr:SH3 domain-containing protein [Bacillota bacterium]
CSGFVQAAFNIQDYKQSSTTLLNNYFTKIDMSSLQHMDILDKPGDHVVIFDKWGTLNGISGAFTYEATTDQYYGGIQGTKRYFLSMNTINNGYIPARYINILEDTAAPSAGTSSTVGTTSDASTTSGTTSTSTTGTTTVTTGTTTTASSGTTSTTTATPQFQVGGYAQVANVTTYANLRANPGTSYAILTTVPRGTILNLAGYSNGWYQVTYSGKTGWMSESILGAVPAGQYVTVNGVYQLNIRLNPSSTAQIMGVLSQGQYAQKLDQTSDGSWYKISINGIQGWSSSKYLTYIQ